MENKKRVNPQLPILGIGDIFTYDYRGWGKLVNAKVNEVFEKTREDGKIFYEYEFISESSIISIDDIYGKGIIDELMINFKTK